VMEEGEACPLLVLHLLHLHLGDHQLTSVPFLLHIHQTHHVAAAVIADSKGGVIGFVTVSATVLYEHVSDRVHTVLIV
jgi:hypothetical protein